MIEVNCETDFVAKTEDFRNAVDKLLVHVREKIVPFGFTSCAGEELQRTLFDQPLYGDRSGQTVGEMVSALIAKIGENIVVRRMVRIKNKQNDRMASYIHGGGRVGVIVLLQADSVKAIEAAEFRDLARKLALHIAASAPSCITSNDVPPGVIEREKEIYRAQSEHAGKPANVIEKMIEGKLKSFFKETCLLEQVFVAEGGNNKDTVQTVLKAIGERTGATLSVSGFTRFKLGEVE